MLRTALAALTILISGCAHNQEEISVRGWYIPSHEGNAFLPCNTNVSYEVYGLTDALSDATETAKRSFPASTYVEGRIIHTSDQPHYKHNAGVIEFIDISKHETMPFPSECPHG